ncbi:hypothetical protein A6A27_27705 [Micromonospora sp. CB01531]|nr:hypothetical protein A6A27_27705 [Micromonospora sp. CB01531]
MWRLVLSLKCSVQFGIVRVRVLDHVSLDGDGSLLLVCIGRRHISDSRFADDVQAVDHSRMVKRFNESLRGFLGKFRGLAIVELQTRGQGRQLRKLRAIETIHQFTVCLQVQ